MARGKNSSRLAIKSRLCFSLHPSSPQCSVVATVLDKSNEVYRTDENRVPPIMPPSTNCCIVLHLNILMEFHAPWLLGLLCAFGIVFGIGIAIALCRSRVRVMRSMLDALHAPCD